MGFWVFMMICSLLIPFTMIVLGKLFIKNPPQEINGVFGYRTKMSMKNKDTWEFAHKYCGKLWVTIGCIMLPLSLIAMLFIIGKGKDPVGILGGIVCCIQTVFLVISIIPTEKALKRTFDENGNRKKTI